MAQFHGILNRIIKKKDKMKLILFILFITIIYCAETYQHSARSHYFNLKDEMLFQSRNKKVEEYKVKRYYCVTFEKKQLVIDLKKNMVVFKGDIIDGLPYLGNFYYENIYGSISDIKIDSI